MFLFEELAGSWPALTSRLDSADVLSGWSRCEPLLAAVTSVAELRRLTALRVGSSAQRGELIDAVVRLAAASGGDDLDAALVALHLMAPGAVNLCMRLSKSLLGLGRDLAQRVPELVVGELMVQIRSFPVHRRGHRTAPRLLWATYDAVSAELRSLIREVPVSSGRLDAALTSAAERAPHGADVDAWELLAWAEQAAVLSATDAALLRELSVGGPTGETSARLLVARQFGVNERTVRRRRDRALEVLRCAAHSYFAAA